ncbi:hypothetical protein FRB90_000168 [Tulasnella sp. 427]|nr:hypothetical protein FRB90_000168 [Tulasnella sp. 427]
MLPTTPSELAKLMHDLGISKDDFLKAASSGPLAFQQLLSSASSMSHDVLQNQEDNEEISAGLSDMIKQLEEAKARFKAEKDLPPVPFVAQPRMQLLVPFEAKRQRTLAQEEGSYVMTKQTVIGVEAHVSRTPLEKLDRTRMFSVHLIVEDPNGDVCLMELYNYPGTIGASSGLVEALFPVGSILAVREPTMKSAAYGGGPLLRVDCPSNVTWLEPDDEKLRSIRWRTGDRVPHTPGLPRTEEEWKKQGNGHFRKGWYIPAAVSYGRGLARFPASSVLRLNRAMAYLQLRFFGAALMDCETALENKELLGSLKPKALFRAAQALYGMGRWDQAERRFTEMELEHPTEVNACKKWVEKCRYRMKESTEGKYDWVTMYQNVQMGGVLDVADYTGPVRVTKLSSCGGGRGIIASRDIQSGELLMVSKAFVSCPSDDYANPEIFTTINLITNRMDMGYRAVMATKVAERIAGCPDAINSLNQLYAGPGGTPPLSNFEPVQPSKIDLPRLLNFQENLDVERTEAILSFNGFSIHPFGPGGSQSENANASMDSCGLFLLPSLFNHSCSPSAFWYCLGDVMVIRACGDIPVGNEVLISYGAGGASHASRGKNSCLARLLGSCSCSLCARDRQAEDAICNQREEISSKISTCTTASAVRVIITQLEKTFQGYPQADQYDMFTAYMKLSVIYKANGDHIKAIQSVFKCLEFGGLKVLDTSVRGSLPSSNGQTSRTIELAIVERSRIGPSLGQMVDICVGVHNAFGELGDVVRAARWLRGAVWRKS